MFIYRLQRKWSKLDLYQNSFFFKKINPVNVAESNILQRKRSFGHCVKLFRSKQGSCTLPQ